MQRDFIFTFNVKRNVINVRHTMYIKKKKTQRLKLVKKQVKAKMVTNGFTAMVTKIRTCVLAL